MKKFLHKLRSYSIIVSLASRKRSDYHQLGALLNREPLDSLVKEGAVSLRIASPTGPEVPDFNGIPIISMGWSGTPLSQLTRQEAEWEVTWARRNPWKTGVEQLWRQPATRFFPVSSKPDDLRRLSEDFRTTLFDTPSGTRIYRNGETLPVVVPTVSIRSDQNPRGPFELSRSPTADTAVVHLNLLPGFYVTDVRNRLVDLLTSLENAAAIPLVDLEALQSLPNSSPIRESKTDVPLISTVRRFASISPVRKDLSDFRERNYTVLETLGLPVEKPSNPAPPPPPVAEGEKIESLGTMAGRALFSDRNLHVTTLGGRLAELASGENRLLPLQRAQGYVSSPAIYSEMKAAQAFENKYVHGVLEESDLAGISCDGRLFFAEHYPALLWRMAARFPDRWFTDYPTVAEEFSLLRLYLGAPTDSVLTIETWYPDGSRRSWDIPNSPGVYTVTGSTIRFPDTFNFLSLAGIDTSIPIAVEVRERSHRNDWYIHPFLHGFNVEMTQYAGYLYTTTLALGYNLAPEGTIFTLPSTVTRYCLPYTFQRISPE